MDRDCSHSRCDTWLQYLNVAGKYLLTLINKLNYQEIVASFRCKKLVGELAAMQKNFHDAAFLLVYRQSIYAFYT